MWRPTLASAATRYTVKSSATASHCRARSGNDSAAARRSSAPEFPLLRCTARPVGELLAGEGGGVHEAAFRDGEHRHALVVLAHRRRIVLGAAGVRLHPVGPYARPGGGRDGDGTCTRGELESAGLEFIECSFVLEKDHLAVGLSAGLKSRAELL